MLQTEENAVESSSSSNKNELVDEDPAAYLSRERLKQQLQRQKERRNIWKEPKLRYARRCSRSPSPIRGRKVAFKLGNLEQLLEEDDSREAQQRKTSTSDTEKSKEKLSPSSRNKASTHSCLRYATHAKSLEQHYSDFSSELRRVNFHQVAIHSHPIILGDNPGVSAGPPLSIDWIPFETELVLVDEHQATRDLCPPRSMRQLKLGQGRWKLLMKDLGYAPEEIRRVLKLVARIQEWRQSVVQSISDAGNSLGGTGTTSQRVSAGKAPKIFTMFSKTKTQQA